MLCISDYHHPSDDDVNLPRCHTIAHSNKCIIRHDSDDENALANLTVAFVVDESGASVNDCNAMCQSCVEAIVDETSVPSTNSLTDNYGGIG